MFFGCVPAVPTKKESYPEGRGLLHKRKSGDVLSWWAAFERRERLAIAPEGAGQGSLCAAKASSELRQGSRGNRAWATFWGHAQAYRAAAINCKTYPKPFLYDADGPCRMCPLICGAL